MTAEEVDQREKEAFMEWRREIAALEEQSSEAKVTPFEKNLEVWRQLWRVMERCGVAFQIVDARNPLLYYTNDLITYGLEHKPPKPVLLLINKADYLTEYQRRLWAIELEGMGIKFAFYSAIHEQQRIDEAASREYLEMQEHMHQMETTAAPISTSIPSSSSAASSEHSKERERGDILKEQLKTLLEEEEEEEGSDSSNKDKEVQVAVDNKPEEEEEEEDEEVDKEEESDSEEEDEDEEDGYEDEDRGEYRRENYCDEDAIHSLADGESYECMREGVLTGVMYRSGAPVPGERDYPGHAAEEAADRAPRGPGEQEGRLLHRVRVGQWLRDRPEGRGCGHPGAWVCSGEGCGPCVHPARGEYPRVRGSDQVPVPGAHSGGTDPADDCAAPQAQHCQRLQEPGADVCGADRVP